jgi:GT2 family glycosyltransferase
LTAAIILPTRRRAGYLRVTLASVMPQAAAARVDVVVVDDADTPDGAARAVAAAAGARVVPGPARGINGARNAGVAAAGGAQWLFFLDDDAEARAGWLDALLAAARAAPDGVGFLTGPIHARLEDHPLRSCGRERPPITTFDIGEQDTDSAVAWGVNMGVRRAVLDLVGPFDERLVNGGDEEELQQRWKAARPDGRIRYVAAAAVDHRRAGDDARLGSLARAARARGQAARRFDVHRGAVPPLRSELAVFARCALHVPRYRCLNGVVLVAHTLGRIDEARRPTPAPTTPGVDDFLSGAGGQVGGWRGRLARVQDALLDLQLPRAPAQAPPGGLRVLVVGIERPEIENTLGATLAELRRSQATRVAVRTTIAGTRGKFENLNALLAAEQLDAYDWLIVVDDDVDLPSRFLDRFLTHAAGAKLAQPAHRLHSHAAWPHTRRRAQSVARPTTFVEIGPLTAFHRDTFDTLLPFPELRMGWGLDAHWAAIARDRGWPMVIVDATPIGHTLRPAAATYPREAALAEARAFLAGRPYVTRDEVR